MENRTISIQYRSHQGAESLTDEEQYILNQARDATRLAYAPYSRFRVGAAALLTDNRIVKGSNQENASFPAGICAERVLLAALSSLDTTANIRVMAISYIGEGLRNDKPLSPCGVCRQVMAEYEERVGAPFKLILSGMSGEVHLFDSASMLLPFRFSGTELPA
jgi:cytidine deaminase